jgi:hypothetical protein
LVSDYIKNSPENSGAIVLAPNTGKADQYNYQSIDATIPEVDDTLREDVDCFRARRGSIYVDEE